MISESRAAKDVEGSLILGTIPEIVWKGHKNLLQFQLLMAVMRYIVS
jgi:hypothetical protein